MLAFLLYVMLSIGSINALVPIILILLLIVAAAGLNRGFSLFNIFGITTLAGINPAGKASIAGKTGFHAIVQTWHMHHFGHSATVKSKYYHYKRGTPEELREKRDGQAPVVRVYKNARTIVGATGLMGAQAAAAGIVAGGRGMYAAGEWTGRRARRAAAATGRGMYSAGAAAAKVAAKGGRVIGRGARATGRATVSMARATPKAAAAAGRVVASGAARAARASVSGTSRAASAVRRRAATRARVIGAGVGRGVAAAGRGGARAGRAVRRRVRRIIS